MSFCPEAKTRAAMTDAEFWDHVFGPNPEEEASREECRWAMDGPDVWAISCARCQRTVEIDDPEIRERDAFCDECADEMMPDLEETT